MLRVGSIVLRVDDVQRQIQYAEDQAGEVQRLLVLGATEIHRSKRPPDAHYVILADPEGNRFCVVDAG